MAIPTQLGTLSPGSPWINRPTDFTIDVSLNLGLDAYATALRSARKSFERGEPVEMGHLMALHKACLADLHEAARNRCFDL